MAMLQSDTRTVRIDADARTVFDFVSDPSNLPNWAVHFCKEIEDQDGKWIVTTPEWVVAQSGGRLSLRVVADATTGVIDYWMSPAPGVELPARSRVIADGDGAKYVFTQFRAPDMPDAVFERQVNDLIAELSVLKRLLEGGGPRE